MSKKIGKNSVCPVCRKHGIHQILQYQDIPLLQNKSYKTELEAKEAPVNGINLCICEECGFVFNPLFGEKEVIYDETYYGSQYYSLEFQKYIEEQIEWLQNTYIKPHDTIVEVGCGKGYYIKRLAEKIKGSGMKYGFDTTYEGEEIVGEGLRYYKTYYNEVYEKRIQPDIVINRHVIEHVPDPVSFLSGLRRAVRSGAYLFIETPDVEWIFKNHVFYDIFHEHCSLFNFSSIEVALHMAGFEVVEKKNTYGEQYMCIIAVASQGGDEPKKESKEVVTLGKQFSTHAKDSMDIYIKKLTAFKEKGEINAIWGAGAKGNILLNLMDKNRRIIDYAIDINQFKQNMYIGGTGHFIISPKEISKMGIKNIMVLNPIYLDEIKNEIKNDIQNRGVNVLPLIIK